jgi:hypothetical protein
MVGALLELERHRFDGDPRTVSFHEMPTGIEAW